MTSFGVVARVRRRLSEEAGHKIKVGHTGTLDPFATGLMIIVVGKACREASRFSKLDKIYEATIKLGEVSTTGDPEGDITSVNSNVPLKKDVDNTLKLFLGEIEQTPPIFSAIKIDGQRAYAMARRGEPIEMPIRKVTIYSLEAKHYEYPNLHIKTHVGSGTYIRSLATDIGQNLGTGAYVSQLKRTTTGSYTIKQAITIEEANHDKLISIDTN